MNCKGKFKCRECSHFDDYQGFEWCSVYFEYYGVNCPDFKSKKQEWINVYDELPQIGQRIEIRCEDYSFRGKVTGIKQVTTGSDYTVYVNLDSIDNCCVEVELWKPLSDEPKEKLWPLCIECVRFEFCNPETQTIPVGEVPYCYKRKENWISIKDELPNLCQVIKVKYNDKFFAQGFLIKTICAVDSYSVKVEFFEQQGREIEVTHWQPVSSEPREENLFSIVRDIDLISLKFCNQEYSGLYKGSANWFSNIYGLRNWLNKLWQEKLVANKFKVKKDGNRIAISYGNQEYGIPSYRENCFEASTDFELFVDWLNTVLSH